MRLPAFFATFLVLVSASLAAPTEEKAPAKVKEGTRSIIHFDKTCPMTDPAQLQLRTRAADDPAPYDLSRETFEVLVPRNYKEGVPYGLFIWISPNEKAALPKEWDDVLADKKLIFIGALNAGNNRESMDRFRLAIDANDHMRNLYTIDPKRVYVAGHSGGARVASMLGVTYSDMFNGAACFMGVNFYQNTVSDKKEMYEMRYFPHPDILTDAKTNGRYALITGEKDMNLDNTKTIFEKGFKAEGFKNVELFNIPNQGHGAPEASWLKKVITFLDGGK